LPACMGVHGGAMARHCCVRSRIRFADEAENIPFRLNRASVSFHCIDADGPYSIHASSTSDPFGRRGDS
jgi:hypothetical protein